MKPFLTSQSDISNFLISVNLTEMRQIKANLKGTAILLVCLLMCLL